jgi:hypothetical protein
VGGVSFLGVTGSFMRLGTVCGLRQKGMPVFDDAGQGAGVGSLDGEL